MRVQTILLLATMMLVGMLLSGVALAGTPGPDTINGSDKPNRLHGGTGNDNIYGNGGNDGLWGDPDNDDLHGGKDNDQLDGGLGWDRAWGDKGNDWFSPDTEILKVSRQQLPAEVDQSNGGPGDDTFVSVDGNPDIINCGNGNDRVWADSDLDDVAQDCEKVVLCPDGQPGQCPGGPPPEPPPLPKPDRSSRFSL